MVSMLLLLALGIEINKSREHIPTAYEIAAAVTSLGSGPAPVLQDDLAYGATFVGIANMPERQHVKTWNEKPWDESNYSDVRLTIGNTHDFPLENLDLEISVSEGDKEQLIAGIDQLSAVSGVEFRRPSVPQTPPVRLRGRDGNTYNLPIDSMLDKTHFPSPSYKMFCPRLLAKDGLRLIIAAAFTGRIKRPPERLRISGSYETAPSEGSKRVQVDKIVQVAK